MWSLVAALVMCAAPSDLEDSVDIWEVNRLICLTTGKEVFTQHIWWRVETHKTREGEVTDFFVAAWRINRMVHVIPQQEVHVYAGRFFDGKDKVFRTIRAKQFIETETTVDYETVDRGRLSESQRSGLRQKTGRL